MNRWHLLTCAVAVCVMMSAPIGTAQNQPSGSESQPYQPAVPSSNTVNAYGGYGGYPGYSGASTAAGSAMNGMANAISAKGNYNLSTSAAAVNMTQAQKNEIQNHQTYENTYFQMRQTNQAYQKSQQSPVPTEQEMARWARDAAPQPVSPSEVSPVSGKINWPAALMQSEFSAQRAEMDKFTAKKASYGSLSISDQMDARKTVEAMFEELKSQITELPMQDYMAARTFLRSLIYDTAHTDLQ